MDERRDLVDREELRRRLNRLGLQRAVAALDAMDAAACPPGPSVALKEGPGTFDEFASLKAVVLRQAAELDELRARYAAVPDDSLGAGAVGPTPLDQIGGDGEVTLQAFRFGAPDVVLDERTVPVAKSADDSEEQR